MTDDSTPGVSDSGYEHLLQRIAEAHQHGQARAYRAINATMLETYWEIGRHVVEFEQGGQSKAAYGKQLLPNLSRDLTRMLGKGYNRSGLNHMRLLYLRYPICATLSHKLSWSHYVELIKIDDELERGFYEKQALREGWNVRQLQRQKESALFLRLALSTDKAGVLQLAQRGQSIAQPRDIVRDAYVLEFLNVPVRAKLSEKNLESRLMEHLQSFLLELGKGFTFVGRQYRITIDNEPYKVDLVFYHRILRCFVLIDLKLGRVKHRDIGQMNTYLGYFAEEENGESDNPPIGIILTREKNELLVKYATYGMSSQLFVSNTSFTCPTNRNSGRSCWRSWTKPPRPEPTACPLPFPPPGPIFTLRVLHHRR